jgi:glycosyltransferase involved in cell wall biosynthesis
MACGAPVVAADRAALPETCGDAALLVDPDDRSALALAVVAAATDEDLRRRLRAAGLRRAAYFSWDRTAREVHALLLSLISA